MSSPPELRDFANAIAQMCASASRCLGREFPVGTNSEPANVHPTIALIGGWLWAFFVQSSPEGFIYPFYAATGFIIVTLALNFSTTLVETSFDK